jgi:hypothetical protein
MAQRQSQSTRAARPEFPAGGFIVFWMKLEGRIPEDFLRKGGNE